MLSLSEILSDNIFENFKPTNVLKSIKNRYCRDKDFSVELNNIINTEKIKRLSVKELFVLLWWFSCKNNFIYQEDYFKQQAKNGNIGKILQELNERKLKKLENKIVKIKIKNYKNIENYCIDINKNIVLIESNKFGKTNFLSAMLWAFCENPIFDIGIIPNIDMLNKFKNKIIDGFNVSVEISFSVDGDIWNMKRVLEYSIYKKTNRFIEINDVGFYNQEFLFNNVKCTKLKYLEKIKSLYLPDFIDNLEIYNLSNYEKLIDKYTDKAKGGQMFIVSYDNRSKEFIYEHTLIKQGKEFQKIIINN
ncbi:MAG: hypothetical protein J6Q51_00060 [Clostridia bacterium]|nr:hypothetical protein [Clostridia bacterium]